MNKTIRNQTIALSGISQTVDLVHQIASKGTANETAMTVSINSILKIDADSVEAVYGGVSVYGAIEGLSTGFGLLKKQLEAARPADVYQARYAASLVFLERKLMDHPKMLEDVRIGIEKTVAQTEHFHVLHENVIAKLADIYQNTISQLTPKVMVQGDPVHLQNPDQANKIRALLLAGIRSAVLWRQCGGSRWKLIFYRRSMLEEVRKLHATCRSPD